MKKRFLSIFLSFIMIFSMTVPAFAIQDNHIKDMLQTTQKYMYENVKNPQFSSIGGEWLIFSLARSNAKVPKNYYENYYRTIEKQVKEQKGILTKNKFSEYSRLIIALNSIKKDPRNVSGYNLLNNIADFDNIKKQGINGVIWALIAYDSKNHEIANIKNKKSQNSRQKMIDYILSQEITSKNGKKGGWAMMGDTSDPDITSMTIYALKPYIQTNKKVKTAVDRAIAVLSDMQQSDGGYKGFGVQSPESTSQVIIALTTLGINPKKDARFIKYDKNKKANTTLDYLSIYYVKGGGFKHTLDGKVDLMATEQATQALSSYMRFNDKKTSIFDMSDVKI